MTRPADREFDVLICGYGPTGAVAANLLGQRGLRVLAIDVSEHIYDIPRAVHFDAEVMRIFQSLGLSQEIASVSGTAERLAFVNGLGITLMSADTRDAPITQGWPIGNFFNQPLLERHLRDGVARYPTVEVRLGWELESFEAGADGVEVRIRSADGGEARSVRVAYLLGCDGASSPTRRGAGIELEDLECDEPWLVCDLILEDDVEVERCAVQICDPKRPTTLVPCEGGHIRWEFMLRPGDDPEHLEEEATARAMMAPHMHRVAPGLGADRGKLVRSKVYTFHALVAKTFQNGRVFVLGDAAHQTPPFLGQGMCAGIRDAYNLCWKLAGVLEGRFHESLLDTYTSERRPHARAVVREAVRTGAVIQATSRLKAFTRDLALLFSRLVPGRSQRLQWAPGWSLGAGLFDSNEAPGREDAFGRPIDQPFVQSQRLDDLLGDGFALVGLGVDPSELLQEAARAAVSALEIRSLDVGDALREWQQRIGVGRVAIVRPDRQVYGVFDGDDEALGRQLSAALERLRSRLTR